MFMFKKIGMDTIKESFKPGSGVSSTRVMSYIVWQFTKSWMILFGGVFLLLFTLDAFKFADIDVETLDGMIKFFTWSVIILLVAAFTPKSISQLAEVFPKLNFFGRGNKDKEKD